MPWVPLLVIHLITYSRLSFSPIGSGTTNLPSLVHRDFRASPRIIDRNTLKYMFVDCFPSYLTFLKFLLYYVLFSVIKVYRGTKLCVLHFLCFIWVHIMPEQRYFIFALPASLLVCRDSKFPTEWVYCR